MGFLYDPQKDYSYGVNGISIFIWRFLETHSNFTQLLDTIKTHFTNIPENIETDVVEILTDMSTHGLITIQPPSSGENR